MIEKLSSLLQYLPVLLSSTNVDDYFMFDKVNLAIQCWSGMIESCYRGLGM